MTVVEAVEAYKTGRLESAAGATVPAHAGSRPALSRAAAAGPLLASAQTAAVAEAHRREEVAELERISVDLRRQLADVMGRISKLEEER